MALSKLNKEQYTAATAPLGHNLIIASAGTGKTSTIVARIAHLLNLGVSPEKILLLTFTNKASSEMISRLKRYFDEKITTKITAGTFHSVSYSLLKSLEKSIILKQPSELKVLLKSLVEKRQFRHISDIKPYGGSYLYDIYSLYQNKESKLSFFDWFCINYEDQSCFAEIYDDILREFELEKDKFNYADFNDILLKIKKELENGAPLFFDEILVDEYQDTNTLQGSIIDAFNTKSLFCVGDFDQSIYAFNGANIEIIASFKDRFKDATIHTLNVNYRSSSSILALANRVITNNPRLYAKSLIVGRNGSFKSPKLLIYDELMAQYIDISKQISNSNYNEEDIAVIFRNNSSADGVEVALKELGIKSKRKGGISFFESREVKAFMDLVGILINSKDIMAFINTCEFAKGVGSAISKEIFDSLIKLGGGSLVRGFLEPNLDVNIFEKRKKNYQLGLFDDSDNIGSASRFNDINLNSDFRSHPILKNSKLSIDGALYLCEIYNFLRKTKGIIKTSIILKDIRNSKIFALIVNSIATKRATSRSGKVDLDRKDSEIEKIYNKIQILDEIAKNYAMIEKFYNFITLGSNEMTQGEGVNLLSVHASKGLEFDMVFIIDLVQNRFPNIKLMNMGGSLEEERRLFYVAVTRAKDELVLCYAKFDKIKKMSYEPSQFLKEAGMVK